jgi:hypothetical protein
MRVRLHGPFAELELWPWTEFEPSRASGERLRAHDELEARALLRNAISDATSHALRRLLFELEPTASFDEDQLLDQLARLVLRGQIVVERRPLPIMASEVVERFERHEAEAFENEFEEEIKVVHWLEDTPPPLVVFDSDPEPPMVIVWTSEVEPPPIVVFDSEPESPPVIVWTSESGP